MTHRALTRSVLAAAAGACPTHDACGATLYALTPSHLVRFDSASPGTVVVIGAHGLPPAGNFGVNYLAYHRTEGRFFGFHYTQQAAGNSDVNLFAVDPATGTGQFVANMGSTAPDANYPESLEYVEAQRSLVMSRGPGTFSPQFFTLTPAGVAEAICSNGLDNDYTAYDSRRAILYTTDPNGAGQFTAASLDGCGTTPLGSLQGLQLGELAYDRTDDAFYAALPANGRLYRVTTTDGGAPITITDLGVIGAGPVRGLSTIPPPCVGDLTGDAQVNTSDLIRFLGRFGQGPGIGDFNGDGAVDTADLITLLGRFGTPCP